MAVIVFDVNETLLDLSGLDQPMRKVFGDRAGEVKRLWFARLLHTSTVMTMLGTWQDFGTIGRAVLVDLGQRLDLEVSEDQADEIVGIMAKLSAHEDVRPGLVQLTGAGLSLVALTNSGQATAEAQLTSAGIDDLFDDILSVDAVLRFKPDTAVYDHVRDHLEQRASDLVMVATHDWDCAGALKAGWRAGYVHRPGQAYNPLLQPPTFRGEDMIDLAQTMLDSRSL
ncbi:MAG: haloacid dehalogenase type II [Euzebya sp.]